MPYAVVLEEIASTARPHGYDCPRGVATGNDRTRQEAATGAHDLIYRFTANIGEAPSTPRAESAPRGRPADHMRRPDLIWQGGVGGSFG